MAPAAAAVASAAPAPPATAYFFNHVVVPVLLMTTTPVFCHVTAWLTAQASPTLTTLVSALARDPAAFAADVLAASTPTWSAAALLVGFNGLALLLYAIPGETKYGPLTQNGAKPAYADNGMSHCILFPLLFVLGAKEVVGKHGLYRLSILFDHFGPTVGLLNLGGLAFCLLLYLKVYL